LKLVPQINDRSDTFSLMHCFKAMHNVVEAEVMSNEFINFNLPFQILIHIFWNIVFTFSSSKS